MANIMMNDVCNLACPYCFANKYVNGDTSTDISYKNFKKAVDWINFSSDTAREAQRVALIGGEPLLHHKFADLVMYAVRERRPNQEILVFTNAVLADKYVDLFAKNDINLLVNLNSPADIGQETFGRIEKNLILLRMKNVDFSVGVNLYDEKMDFSFLLEIVEKLGLKSVRVGLVSPNTDEKRAKGPSEYFTRIKPALLQIAEDLAKLHCSMHLDCQKFPMCYISDDIPYINMLMEKYEVAIDLFEGPDNGCHPVIDILTNLDIVRCFGVSGPEIAIPMEAFSTEYDAVKYFETQYDNLAKMIPAEGNCVETNCQDMYCGKCQGGCIGYKIDRLLSLKEGLMQIKSEKKVVFNLEK